MSEEQGSKQPSGLVGRLLSEDEFDLVAGGDGYGSGGDYTQSSGGFNQTGGNHGQTGGGSYTMGGGKKHEK